MVENPRWSPLAYDADDLKSSIDAVSTSLRHLLGNDPNSNRFYASDTRLPSVCQGDILTGKARIPYINESGVAAAIPNTSNYWLVTGNTCDFSRNEVVFTQLCPIVDCLNVGGGNKLESILRYKTSRLFYLPTWGQTTPQNAAADFTMVVSVKKEALGQSFSREATMSRDAWILLNCCLVRFLARDDGRFD